MLWNNLELAITVKNSHFIIFSVFNLNYVEMQDVNQADFKDHFYLELVQRKKLG